MSEKEKKNFNKVTKVYRLLTITNKMKFHRD